MLLSQINFLKDRLKAEIEGRRIADEDIWQALEQYKDMIQRKVMARRNDIKSK